MQHLTMLNFILISPIRIGMLVIPLSFPRCPQKGTVNVHTTPFVAGNLLCPKNLSLFSFDFGVSLPKIL
jgi:hypothetical protein